MSVRDSNPKRADEEPAPDPGTATSRSGRGRGRGRASSEEGADGRVTRAQQRRAQRRTAILAAARRVFSRKGYHEASIGDIIDEAQIARGTFYLYFHSKREIFAELRDAFLELIRGSVQRISLDPRDGEPLQQMRANFRRVMTVVLEHEQLAAIMLRDPMSFDADTRVEVEQFFDQIISLIERAIEVGHALGMARDCDRHTIAVAALGALREILLRMIDARRTADPPSADSAEGAEDRANHGAEGFPEIEQLVDELLAFFARGVFT